MRLMAENTIIPNDRIIVRKTEKWDESLRQIFIEAEEPWEIEVLRKAIENPQNSVYKHNPNILFTPYENR